MSSACEPFSTMTPSAVTKMTSQSWIVDKRCAIAKEVRPQRAFSSASCTIFSLSVSRADVASSSSSTGGSLTSALQMATRCFWPPERRPPRGPTCVSQPWYLSSSMKFRCAIFLHSTRRSSVMVSPASLSRP
mmetsp:Transcript_142971/g.356266  ORF Transcript_142971/g.356266 Transcript_142971/m.356266 type:complete len:132 (-) Transcript_142971:3463-3858(-)